jgi:MFS family permease
MALFILLLPISSYVAALAFVKDEWDLNNTQAGAVYSASMAGAVFAALVLIPLTDRLGPRRILIGSAILSVVAHTLFPLAANNIVTGVALRVLAGVGFLGVYTPGLRIVAERFAGGGRGTAIGVFVTAQYAAHSGSLAITGALMSNLGWQGWGIWGSRLAASEWRPAYLAVSLMAVVSIPTLFVLLRGTTASSEGGSSGRLDPRVLGNPPVRYLILGYSLHAAQLFAVRVWLPVFLTAVLVARGVSTTQAVVTGATMGGVALAVGSVGPVMGGIISDRWGRARSASAIFALSGVCAFLIGWTVDLPWAVIVAVGMVYGWATAADSAIYQTGVIEVSSPARLGSTMAFQASLGLMGGVVGPIAFGAILDVSPEAYRWVVSYSALGLLAIVAVAGLQRLRTLPQARLLAGGRG